MLHAVAARPTKEGGATRLIRSVAVGLAEVAPHDEFIFCIHEGIETELAPGIDTIRVSPGRGLRRIWFDNRVWPCIVKEEKPDVIVALLGFGALRPPVKKISVLPDSTYFCANRSIGRTLRERLGIWIRYKYLRATLDASSVVIAPSESLARAASATISSRARIEVIRFGWDDEFEDPEKSDTYTPDRPLRLLYVSQLQPHKAHWTLPAILAAARRSFGTEIELTVAVNRRDNPRLWRRFHTEMEKHGVASSITVLSDQSDADIARLYSNSDLFLFPSVCESFGYPMVEATAAGLPIVAVDTPINREMLGPGALYYNLGDAEGAAKAVTALATDRSLRLEVVRRTQDHQRAILPSTTEFAQRLHKVMMEAASRPTP